MQPTATDGGVRLRPTPSRNGGTICDSLIVGVGKLALGKFARGHTTNVTVSIAGADCACASGFVRWVHYEDPA